MSLKTYMWIGLIITAINQLLYLRDIWLEVKDEGHPYPLTIAFFWAVLTIFQILFWGLTALTIVFKITTDKRLPPTIQWLIKLFKS